jgi:hypothetical protein
MKRKILKPIYECKGAEDVGVTGPIFFIFIVEGVFEGAGVLPTNPMSP